MKRIAYMAPFLYERDADGEIVTEKILKFRSIPYSPENIEIAKREAYNGEYTIEDDGQPEPEPTEQEQLRADVDFLLAMGGVL